MKKQLYNQKIIIIGGSNVGKTTLQRSFMGQIYFSHYIKTIRPNITDYEREFESFKVKFQVVDLASCECDVEVMNLYHTKCHGVLGIFDLTCPVTFEQLLNCLYNLRNNTENGAKPIVLIGNKSDLGAKINKAKIIQYKKEISKQILNANSKISYLATSAITGENVNNAFELLSRKIIEFEKTRLTELPEELPINNLFP